MKIEQQIQIMEKLGKLEGQVSEAFKHIGLRLDSINGKVGNHESRVNALEDSNRDAMKFISAYESDKHDKKVEGNKLKVITFDRLLTFASTLFLAYLSYRFFQGG